MKAREIVAEFDAIGELDRAGCLARWREVHGRPPPKHLSIGFMRRALVYEAQCAALGGVPPSLDRALRKLPTGDGPVATSRHSLRPGHHLVRDWNGRTYQVEVLDKGFRMDGKSYRSLSAIAKKITGAEWSGPRFFGLT